MHPHIWPYVPFLLVHLDPTVIALIGTIFGGVGLKAVEHWLGRSKIRTTDAVQIRDELRITITEQKAEIAALEKAVDKWREEYYDLRDKYVALQTDLTLALANIKNTAQDAQDTAEAMKHIPPPTP